MSAELLAPPATPAGAPPHPGPAMRGDGGLARAERLFQRIDAWVQRAVPPEANPLAHLGPVANLLFAIAVASGVALLIWYSPSIHLAYGSLQTLGGRSPGGWMRSVHRYSSDGAILFVVLHAIRALAARQVTGARWLPWLSGVVLLGALWFIGWTGYWLVWDERGQLVARASLAFADVLPVFGGPLGRLLTTDESMPSLLFFVVFFIHMLLPLGFVAGMCVHLARLSRAKIFPNRTLGWWTLAAVAAVAILVPATSAGPARLAVTPERFSFDAWYLWPLALTERMSGGGLWLLTAALFAGLGGLPWWLARRRPRVAFQASVEQSRCHACTQCAQDCPFSAITMVPRTDGKRFNAQASVDPALCVGCGVCAGSCDSEGIGLPWLDVRRETQRIEQMVLAAAQRGDQPLLALVCTESHGGWSRFDAAAWRDTLPGCTVLPVPCIGWIAPKLMERALAAGAAGIVVLGCSTGEAACREGARWFDLRTNGQRKPGFHPDRAGAHPDRVLRLAFDPTTPGRTRAAVAMFASGVRPALAPRPRARIVIAATLLAAALSVATIAGTFVPFRNPAPDAPELVLSIEAWGDWTEATPATAADLAKRPVHMRNVAVTTHRERSPVRLRLTVDGVATEETLRPLGLAHDGACLALARRPLTAGPHAIDVEIFTAPGAAPKFTWQGRVELAPRRASVVLFSPAAGFRLVP
ncbi:MAG: hydrogenase iron-sulfur subunit [Verrucomicrobia bacterium]|nr:hydrogenase iron-sulfur subunit [Verrucomicrobiota bacterium]